MKRTLILGTALALMLGTASTTMNPAFAAKGDKKAGKAGRAANKRPMQAMTPMMLGKVLGTPLTDEQATAVKDANKAYEESIAKAVGLTVEELKAKMVAFRKANPGGKGGAGKGAADVAKPAAP